MENTNQNQKIKQNEINQKKRKEMTQCSDSHAFPGKLLTVQHKGVVVQCDTCTKKKTLQLCHINKPELKAEKNSQSKHS